MNKIFLSLGSNLGEKALNLLNALSALTQHNISIDRISPVYETAPWGEHDQPPFYNICVEAHTALEPLRLLAVLKEIESDMGRVKTRHWGPRLIDIDIIFYNDEVYESEILSIPHKLMSRRAFVLRPLCDIAGDLKHPVLHKTMNELYNMLSEEERNGCTNAQI